MTRTSGREGDAGGLPEGTAPAGVPAGYEELARQAQQEALSYEQYLLGLAERECQERRDKRIGAAAAGVAAAAGEELAGVGPEAAAGEGGATARSLLEGSFVDRRENVLVFGVPGSGKPQPL